MKWAFSLAIVLCALCAFAQPQPESKRMSRIWSSIDDRLDRQSDYWFENGDFPRVIQLLRMRCEFHPHDSDLATNLGWMYGNIERYDDELAAYRRYAKRNPADPDALLPVAEFFFSKKMYDKVPPLLEPTLPRKPQPNAFRILAHAYEKMGKWEQARVVWEKLLVLTPDDLAAKANLAKVKKKLSAKR